ncbi:MAG: hypothetical protein NC453_27395 [Muribaculum sp.]|nr:hypothetical protein [Muribaculum sp.]
MTSQEILASLSQLEQELQSIKSARELVDQTVNSYGDVKNDIAKLIDEFANVSNSLADISNALASENIAISTEIQKTIEIAKGTINNLHESFASQCNTAVVRFMENVNKAAVELATKTDSLMISYAENNAEFKKQIHDLERVHASLIAASESVASLKSDIATLQNQLNQSQKSQDATLERIAAQLQSTSASHSQILTQIASDLKSSQDAQDEDLNHIKSVIGTVSATSNNTETIVQNLAANLDKAMDDIKNISSRIDSRANSLESKMDSLETQLNELQSTTGNLKIMLIINIVISIIAVLAALLK